MVQQSTTLSGLGFSLKPPRWIRKAQPGIFIQKHALPLALVGSAFLIPGAGALAAKGILGAGRLAAGGARGVAAGARNLFSFARGIKAPKLPTQALQQAAQYVAPVAVVPQQMIPVANPTLGPTEMVSAGGPAGMAASGGGGDLVGPPAPDASTAAAPAQAGMGGALMLGALVIGGMMLARPKRKR